MVLTLAALCVVIFLVAYIISISSSLDTEKFSPFECGLIPAANSRTPFSMQFFLISLVFLIFDVELVILFPVFGGYMFMVAWKIVILLFVLVILSVGLVVEWAQAMLEWFKFK